MIDGRRDAEKREEQLFTLLEARMVEIHCGDGGVALAAEMRRAAFASAADEKTTAADELESEGFDLDAESVLGAKLLDEQERAEADAWWREYEKHEAGQ